MKKRTTLKWFTLLEMLIVMIIIWILAVVLTESYISISKVALRIEQQKNISEESLILTQVFQSIADEATIDYDAYSGNSIDLKKSYWYTDVLFLTWWIWKGTEIYIDWEDCLELNENFEPDEDISDKIENASKCKLILKKDWKETILNTSWKVIVSNVKFRVIPYNSDDYYVRYEADIINKLHQPAFWMFIRLYSPLYQPIWLNKIDQPLQLFFNLKL